MDSSTPRLFKNEQINVSGLPRAEDVEWISLEEDYLLVDMVGMYIFRFLIIIAFLFYSFFATDFPGWLRWTVIGIWLFFLISSSLLKYFGFKIKGYAVREHDLLYRAGLIFRRITVIPYNRIQHSEIQQGFIERQFNLARLAVFTAGGSQSDLSIPGLSRERAESMRAYVSEKVDSDEEE